MNANELRAQMARHGDSAKALAKALDMAESTLSCRMNGRRNMCFSQYEIQIIIDRYSLTAEEVMLIFFAPQVSKIETLDEEMETAR